MARRHHPVIRLAHWLSALGLLLMASSGLRIFNAAPHFAPKGEPPFRWWPWEGTPVPAWLTLGGWLGGARHWHFAAMWMVIVAGVLWLGWAFLHGEWRDFTPRRGDARDVIAMLRYYLRLAMQHPRQGKHNALQKYAYLTMLAAAVVAVLSGLAIWKPVTLGWLTDLMGGYALARWWHFLAMLVLMALTAVHVFMVFSTDPYALRAMTTGGYDAERFSPEARNARPFVNLRPAMLPLAAAGAPPPSPSTMETPDDAA
ncbi:MAG: cytochrome b/b6 domain-containing protein [Gemmatimonadaceae bacterium]|jgi:thiosulfate reductase cytochrome b subunit|nr:cytochrome b/b6 domain-containing protein [Gemmatimonadaceae bacterium]